MPSATSMRSGGNLILSHLSTKDLGLIQGDLEPVALPVRQTLEVRNKPFKHVYFLESGFASVVASGAEKRSVEVGIIGREGMTGLPVIMGTDRSPNDTFMQLAGSGRRLGVAPLQAAMEKSASLRRALLNWVHVFVVQTGQTAVANGRDKLEERLARWLLMAHDRAGSDGMAITHEFLSMMLGVRRAGVTVALNLLARRALIQRDRGVITILDRAGLEETTNGGYGAPEAEFRRLFA